MVFISDENCFLAGNRLAGLFLAQIDVFDAFHVNHRLHQRSRFARETLLFARDGQHHVLRVKVRQNARKDLLTVHGLEQVNLHLFAKRALKISILLQRTVNARRGYFEEIEIV